MMRPPTQPHAGCSSSACWFLSLFAVFIILVQASWLHSLRECNVVTRARGDASSQLMVSNESALMTAAASMDVPAPAPEPEPESAQVERERVPDCRRTPPRVLIVTAEPPTECSTTTAQWLGARAMRNRLQYAQEHAYKLYWFTDIVRAARALLSCAAAAVTHATRDAG